MSVLDTAELPEKPLEKSDTKPFLRQAAICPTGSCAAWQTGTEREREIGRGGKEECPGGKK